jgi:AAA ATPase domain
VSTTASATAAGVVGREEELARVSAFLVDLAEGPYALLLEGGPGIGKTTIWQAGVATARERSYQVLACRPTGAEVQLSFAALGDLLAEVLVEALPELAPPRRRALEVALLLEEARGQQPDQRAVALAFLDVLLLLAGSSPVLVAVDDLQWLDAPTAAVLGFALRRVGSEPIGLLAALRIESGQTGPVELERLVPEERLAIGPLSVGALHRLLGTHLGTALPRPALLRLHEQSGGNPFFALGIARALDRIGGRVEPGEPLPGSGKARRAGARAPCRTAAIGAGSASPRDGAVRADDLGSQGRLRRRRHRHSASRACARGGPYPARGRAHSLHTPAARRRRLLRDRRCGAP